MRSSQVWWTETLDIIQPSRSSSTPRSPAGLFGLKNPCSNASLQHSNSMSIDLEPSFLNTEKWPLSWRDFLIFESCTLLTNVIPEIPWKNRISATCVRNRTLMILTKSPWHENRFEDKFSLLINFPSSKNLALNNSSVVKLFKRLSLWSGSVWVMTCSHWIDAEMCMELYTGYNN